MTGEARRLSPQDYLVAIGMNILWGLNIVGMKVTVGATAPFMAGAVRFAVITLVCLPWLKPIPGKTRLLMLLGLIYGGAFVIFMNLALHSADNVGALAIAGQLSSPIGVLLGVLVLGERIGLKRIGGLALAFGGVAMLVFDPRIVHEVPGMLLMIGAATCFATGTLIQRHLAGTPVMTMYGWTGVMGLIVLAPLSLALEPAGLTRALHMGWQPIAWFGFSIFGSTLMGQGGLAWLLSRHPLSTIMPMILLSTLVSVIASHFYFGTIITPIMAIGGLIALAGVLIVATATSRPLPPIDAEMPVEVEA